MHRTICQSLLDLLAEAGAREIFGMTGDVLNPLLEAVRVDDRFRWIGMRHEEHAGYAASAISQLDGRIGVCAGTAGPGALHLINGLYNAQKEGAGVVAITGQLPRAERGSDAHKEMDLERVFADVCAYQAVIDSPAQMPRMAEIAVQKALSERCVTRIELPADVIGEALASEHFARPIVRALPSATPPEADLAKAAEAISAGKRVALFCGIGCRDARDAVLDFSGRLGAPLATTLRAKEIFEVDDPGVVGMTGLIGNPAGFHAIKDCDVLVMLGTDFPYDEFLPDGRPIVQIDHAADHIGRRAPVTHGLVGDVGATLEALAPRVSGDSSHFRDHLLTLRDKWLGHMTKQADLGRADEPMHPQLLARAISDRAADDAIFACDVGEVTIWLARQMHLGGARRTVGGFNHGSVGAGLPTALGAAALEDGRQVWSLCGDGGFGMSMNDLVTAVRYGWPIKVVVFDNACLGFVKMEMEVSGLPRNADATGLVNPDFAAYAKSCGADGVRVEHVDQIVPAIERAIAADGPFLIHAIVSAGELSMPPHITLAEGWGFGISKAREALMGLKGDHEVWKSWRDEFMANLR